jgi:hypothetical protein
MRNIDTHTHTQTHIIHTHTHISYTHTLISLSLSLLGGVITSHSSGMRGQEWVYIYMYISIYIYISIHVYIYIYIYIYIYYSTCDRASSGPQEEEAGGAAAGGVPTGMPWSDTRAGMGEGASTAVVTLAGSPSTL